MPVLDSCRHYQLVGCSSTTYRATQLPMLASCSFTTLGHRWQHYSATVGATQVPMQASCSLTTLPTLATVFRLQFDDFTNVGNIIPPLLARRRIRCCSLQFAVRYWLAAVPMLVSCSLPTPGRRWKHYSTIVG